MGTARCLPQTACRFSCRCGGGHLFSEKGLLAHLPPTLPPCAQEHQPIADAEAGAYFFQDQAQHNEAAHAQIDEVRGRHGPYAIPGLATHRLGAQLVDK